MAKRLPKGWRMAKTASDAYWYAKHESGAQVYAGGSVLHSHGKCDLTMLVGIDELSHVLEMVREKNRWGK